MPGLVQIVRVRFAVRLLAAVSLSMAVGAGSAQGFGSCPAADGTPEDPTYPMRKLAFATDAAGDHEQARHLMRCAIRANPHDVIALKQEVYLDLNAKDSRGAAEDIDALREQGASSAQFEAQEGYLFAAEKKYDDARSAFGRAIAYGDSAITAKAMAALRVLDDEYPRHVLTFYTDAQYLHRFSDGVTDSYVRYFERLGRTSPFQVYANVRLLRDTRSNGGTLPQIFSDNAFLTGVGVVAQPHDAHYFASVEMNEAYVFFGGKAGNGAFVPDLRVVAGYYNTWRPGPDSRLSDRLGLEANGSLGFYSRYQGDTIFYAQPRETYDLMREGTVRLRPFFQQSVSLDANQQFYNDVFELIPGLELQDLKLGGLALRVEYVRGYYLPVANQAVGANPYGPSYNDLRFRLLFQKSVAFGQGAR
jgi:tetratricopeptide (TPR) repeat protein